MKKLILLLWLLLSISAQAEVITDGSLGAQVSLSGSDYAITQDLGTLQGTHLFHSFEQFSLATGESATFSGDATIQNIFSRVTGGQVSTIDGLIRNAIPNADLYLMNPAGVVFSKGASLDLQGSFYTTTADLIRFADDSVFYNSPQQNTILSTAAPSAYGFLDNDIGKIDIAGAKLVLPRAEQLSLVGGNLNIDNAVLFAAAGQILLTSIGSSGELSLEASSLSSDLLDNMTINNSSITANTGLSDTTAGSIYIRANSFTLRDSTLTNSTANSSTTIENGLINIQAQDLVMQGATIVSENTGQSQGGDIIIKAENNVILAAGSATTTVPIKFASSRISTATSLGATGDGGTIEINATNIQIQDGSIIQSSTLDAGHAGDINLIAQNDVTLNGYSNIGNGSSISVNSGSDKEGFVIKSEIGDGGNISINANNLTLNDGANITANSYASGQGGNININLIEKLTLEQESSAGIGNFMSSATTSKDDNAGNGGNIVIQANELLFANGSFLTTNTNGAGNAGNISININQNAKITGISAQTDSGILSAASSASVGGNAGNILLTVGNQLFLDDLAIIDASTFNRGLGGNVNIIAGDITMRNQAYIGAASANSGNTGDINILITKDNLEMYDASYITTNATFADGGNIYVSMPNYVYISGNSEMTTSIQSGVGGGGNINLDAEFTVLEGGKILAQAYGGPGGNINIITTSIYNLTNQPLEQAISASSQLGIDGVVTVHSPDGDTDESVLILTGDFLQADKLLRSLCDKKRSRGNSFVVSGRESYPNLINDWLPSNATQLVLQRCEL
ncbi:MAG: filamentous hemagglutinin N-terminal domain-containing protein [Thiotrichaceae bacterium]|nr:filamentous hemagglutinin N-terminal domain-containing protein [Thiotrichaceae bacterium]